MDYFLIHIINSKEGDEHVFHGTRGLIHRSDILDNILDKNNKIICMLLKQKLPFPEWAL